MSTAPDWLRQDAVAVPRSRLDRLRRASRGAQLSYGVVVVVACVVLYSVGSFVAAVHARRAQRHALEVAAVQALPEGLPVVLRGVYAQGAATGYATAFSPQQPRAVLAGLQPRGRDGWTPVPGTDTVSGLTASRAWIADSQALLLTVEATSCASDRAPVGCPAGGSSLRTQVASGGPRS